MNFCFNLSVNFFYRRTIRRQLKNSKEKFEFWYPNSKVLLTENKRLFSSIFYFEVANAPDTERCKNHAIEWIERIKLIKRVKISDIIIDYIIQ